MLEGPLRKWSSATGCALVLLDRLIRELQRYPSLPLSPGLKLMAPFDYRPGDTHTCRSGQ